MCSSGASTGGLDSRCGRVGSPARTRFDPRYPRFPQALRAGALPGIGALSESQPGSCLRQRRSSHRRRHRLKRRTFARRKATDAVAGCPAGRSARRRRKPKPNPLPSWCPAGPEPSGKGTAKGNLPGFAGGNPMGPTEAERPPPEPRRESALPSRAWRYSSESGGWWRHQPPFRVQGCAARNKDCCRASSSASGW